MSDTQEPTLLEKMRQKRIELGLIAPATPTEEQVWDEELISEPILDKQPDHDDAMDQAVHAIGIDDAYIRWVPKDPPNLNGKRESILVSCPNPAHPDAHPSSWLNLDKNVGNCAVCGGFDQFDIYAWNHGYSVPGYKTDGSFRTVKTEMAAQFGYVVRKTLGGQEYVEHIAAQPEDDNVVDLPGEVDLPDMGLDAIPPIDWRAVLGDDSTFLIEWMHTTSADDLPEEFYFWLGMLAVGVAVGNDVTIGGSHPVRANLMVCLVGSSGQGKSRSVSTLSKLLYEALPYDSSKGVRMIASPGSAEALIDEFSKPIIDQTTGVITGYEPVRGIMRISELAELVSKANRLGNTTKQTMMDLFDSPSPIATRSRGSGLARAENHFCSVISTTQPKMVRQLLSASDADSGFINRWVFATGKSKTMAAWNLADMDTSGLVPLLRGIRAWGGPGRSLGITNDALAVWSKFFYAKLVPLKLDEDASTFGRIDLLFKKIMLLLAIDRHRKEIDMDIVESAILLWPYLAGVYGIVESQLGRTEETEVAELILSILRKRKGEATMRDIMRGVGRRTGMFPRWVINKTLKVMIELGEVEELAKAAGPKGGRPTVTYRAAQ
ncbi:MAG: hypothetical protein AB7O86_05820 [Porticoccaceae bacterium]